MKNNQSRSKRLLAKQAQVVEMLNRLQAEAAEHFGKNPDAIGWGDVGDIGAVEQALRQISDKVFKDGEYAE